MTRHDRSDHDRLKEGMTMTTARQIIKHQLLFICIYLQDINLDKYVEINLHDVH